MYIVGKGNTSSAAAMIPEIACDPHSIDALFDCGLKKRFEICATVVSGFRTISHRVEDRQFVNVLERSIMLKVLAHFRHEVLQGIERLTIPLLLGKAHHPFEVPTPISMRPFYPRK